MVENHEGKMTKFMPSILMCPIYQADYATWIPEIRNESFDRVSPIIYFQEQPTAV